MCGKAVIFRGGGVVVIDEDEDGLGPRLPTDEEVREHVVVVEGGVDGAVWRSTGTPPNGRVMPVAEAQRVLAEDEADLVGERGVS